VSLPPVAEIAPARFAAVAPRVARIEERARATDGHESLGETIRWDLEHPGADSAGFLAGDAGYAHVARSDTLSSRQWTVATAVVPEARTSRLRAVLAEHALRHVAAHGGGHAVLWLFGAADRDDADDADDAELVRAGLRVARELYEMRVPLPVAEAAAFPAPVTVRTFEAGRDEQAWLEVNNRAFAHHPEQGGWTRETLARRTSEPWFDPSLFLLAFDASGLAGFNWLKLHEARGTEPRLGEIFVIGIDPRAQGSGLGRALALEGLHRVAARGIDTGMLFCAAENAPALALYRSLGFTVHRVDRAYECEVEAA